MEMYIELILDISVLFGNRARTTPDVGAHKRIFQERKPSHPVERSRKRIRLCSESDVHHFEHLLKGVISCYFVFSMFFFS